MDPSLYKAASSGDLEFLRELTADNRPSDILLQKTPKGNNALHIAAQFKHTSFFKQFPQDLQSLLFWAKNIKDDTPLFIASRVGCVELVEFLIDHAKNSLTDPTDLEAGAVDSEAFKDVLRVTNSDGDTALHVAVKSGHLDVVDLLMDAGPELSSFTNNANESPLFLAISKGFPKIGSCILDKSSEFISFEGVKGVTALHAAVTRNKTCKDIVKKMVSKNGEMVKAVDELGWTPLHYAAFKGNVEVVKLLMGPDNSLAAYILDKCGMSALHIAAHAGQVETMKELLRLRPDTCDLLNHKGQNVLHVAVLGESVVVVRYILKTPEIAGLVNEADNDGNTPFHLAALKRNTRILRIMRNNRKVDKRATNTNHAKAVDIFIGEKLEVLSLGLNDIIRFIFGRAIGVPMFHQHVCQHVQLSERSEEEVSSATTIIANDSAETNFLNDWKKFDTNLLIAMLIATVTFSAAVNMPGGFNVNGNANKHRNIFFSVFVLFDSISFCLSVFAVFNYFMVLTVTQVTLAAPNTPAVCIRYSIAAMALAFASGVFVVLPNYSPLGILVLLICSTLCFLIVTRFYFYGLPTVRRMRVRHWFRTRVV